MKFQKQVKQQKKLTSSLQIIASGPEGVYQTLKIMKQLVKAGKKRYCS